jgi:hypothetical protein
MAVIIWRSMSDDLIVHMQARVEQIRKVMKLAHDPRIIKMLQDVIDSGEEDIRKLEAKRNQRGS